MHQLEIVNGKAQMFSVRQVPWHKLGTILDNPPTSAEAIIEAGLDWNVELKPIYWKKPADIENPETFSPFPNRCALVRDRDNTPLSIISNNYKPLQNKVAFEWFDTFVKEKKAAYETAGSLQGGKKIWILAKLGSSFEVVKGDEIRKYILLCNGHDGVTGILIQPTPVRVVCANTLASSLGAGLVNTIWHHGNIKDKMDRVKRILGLAEEEFESKKAIFSQMVAFSMSQKLMDGYVEALIPPANEEATDRVKNTAKYYKERIWNLFETGMGTDIPGVKGTLWGAYQSAIEFGEYDMPRKVRDLGNFQIFGLGAQFKKRTYDKAVEMIGVK